MNAPLHNPTPIQSAAFALRVPATGVAWLDQMIDESNQQRTAELAMMMLMLHNTVIEAVHLMRGEDMGSPWSEGDIATFARQQAAAMYDPQLRLPLDDDAAAG